MPLPPPSLFGHHHVARSPQQSHRPLQIFLSNAHSLILDPVIELICNGHWRPPMSRSPWKTSLVVPALFRVFHPHHPFQLRKNIFLDPVPLAIDPFIWIWTRRDRTLLESITPFTFLSLHGWRCVSEVCSCSPLGYSLLLIGKSRLH